MSNAFEYGDALLPPTETSDDDGPLSIESNQPYLNLATYVLLVYFWDNSKGGLGSGWWC